MRTAIHLLLTYLQVCVEPRTSPLRHNAARSLLCSGGRCMSLLLNGYRSTDGQTDRQRTAAWTLAARSAHDDARIWREKIIIFAVFRASYPNHFAGRGLVARFGVKERIALCSNSIRPTSTCRGFVVGLRQVAQQIHSRLK